MNGPWKIAALAYTSTIAHSTSRNTRPSDPRVSAMLRRMAFDAVACSSTSTGTDTAYFSDR